MENNFDKCLELVLKHEGGFVNDPKDPGGATNLGMTQKTWEKWIGHKVSIEDMKNLTVDDISPVYKSCYWGRVKSNHLPPGLDYCAFDASINSGVKQSSKWLQRSVGANDDGIVGSQTLKYVSHCSPVDSIHKFCDLRLTFLKTLKNWDHSGSGWNRRVDDVRKESLAMYENK